MTWMELLKVLEAQPYKTLQQELRFFTNDEERCVDFGIVEIASPLDLTYDDLYEGIDEFPLQIRLKPTYVHNKHSE